MVEVKIEYCGMCDYTSQCYELAETVKELTPNANVSCIKGRRGSFEVEVNNVLVHSKLNSLAFPEFWEVAAIAQNASQGLPIRAVAKHQPITDCNIM